MEKEINKIGGNLKRFREYIGYTQNSIAGFLEVDQSMISFYESGERNLSVDKLERLADLFGISKDSFYNDDVEIKNISHSISTNDINNIELNAIADINRIYANCLYMDDLYQDKGFKRNITIKSSQSSQATPLLESIDFRKAMGIKVGVPFDIFSLSFIIDNLTTVYYPMGERLSGMCFKNDKNIVVGINSEMPLGRQRFSFAREIYRSFFDKTYVKSTTLMDIGVGNIFERLSDSFAFELLIPSTTLSRVIKKIARTGERLNLENIIFLEQYFGVSREAMLFRLISDNIITREEAELMVDNVIEYANRLGYSDSLYLPTSIEKEYYTLGRYLRLLDIINQKEIISTGKYEELLLNAFRADIVYGDLSGFD